MLELKLNHVSKSGPRREAIISTNDPIHWRLFGSYEVSKHIM